MPIAQEISGMLDTGRKPSQVISIVIFTSKIGLNRTEISVPIVRWVYMLAFDGYGRSHR